MQLNSCRCQLEFPIEPSLCNVRELHLLIVFQDLFFLTSVAIQCQNLTSCLLKNLQLHIFLPPDPLWSYLKQPYPKAVSYNVDGTVKTFLNVCESLLKILLVHQHVNGCSHCSEVKKKKKKKQFCCPVKTYWTTQVLAFNFFCSLFILSITASWLGQKLRHNYLLEASSFKRIAVPSIEWASCFVCTWTVHLPQSGDTQVKTSSVDR